jgi:hypothetical protein
MTVGLVDPTSSGFMFADHGYDVWLGNFRGNDFSREHEHLDASDPDYWDFRYTIYEIVICEIDNMLYMSLFPLLDRSYFFVQKIPV